MHDLATIRAMNDRACNDASAKREADAKRFIKEKSENGGVIGKAAMAFLSLLK